MCVAQFWISGSYLSVVGLDCNQEEIIATLKALNTSKLYVVDIEASVIVLSTHVYVSTRKLAISGIRDAIHNNFKANMKKDTAEIALALMSCP